MKNVAPIAIILAAGRGIRLKGVEYPKCLLRFGGKSLLERHLLHLAALGVQEAAVVVGYSREMIDVELQKLNRSVRTFFNSQYKRGSLLSLWTAAELLDRPVVIMDADVLYGRDLLARMIKSPQESCFLMDGTHPATGEEMMLGAANGRVISIQRLVPPGCDNWGEGVGFLRLGAEDALKLSSILEQMSATHPDDEYEAAVHRLLAQTSIGYERIDGLPWIEIDFIEDVERAEKEIFPRLRDQLEDRR